MRPSDKASLAFLVRENAAEFAAKFFDILTDSPGMFGRFSDRAAGFDETLAHVGLGLAQRLPVPGNNRLAAVKDICPDTHVSPRGGFDCQGSRHDNSSDP